MKPRSATAVVAFLVLHVLLARTSNAQNPRGTLRGNVHDASGRRVAGAKIVLNEEQLSITRETLADRNGEFRIEEIPASSYLLIVTAPGFAEVRSEVVVAASSLREVGVILRPRSVTERVVVDATAQSITSGPLDTATAVHQALVYRQDLETIPLAARSFANIAYLAPGTEPVEPSDPTEARITAVFTGGRSGLNNELSVDGGDNSDNYIGGFLQNFSPDAIQELAFRTAQADADTGRTTAGSVLITTRGGTNTWHGGFSIYDRQAALIRTGATIHRGVEHVVGLCGSFDKHLYGFLRWKCWEKLLFTQNLNGTGDFTYLATTSNGAHSSYKALQLQDVVR